MHKDVLQAILDVAQELRTAVIDAIEHGAPTTDEHRFERLDGKVVGFGFFIVPSGPGHDAVMETLKAHFGDPATSIRQTF